MPRPLSNPLTSFLLAGLLLYDLTHLSPLSTAGRWLSGARTTIPLDAGGGPSALIARTSAGLEVFDREAALVTQEPRLLAAEWMLLGDFREVSSTSGFWGLTTRRLTSAVHLLNPQSETRPISPAIEAEARAALIDWLIAHRGLPAADAARLRPGNTYRVVPLWPGYLHNALSLTALTLFGLSLTWIPRQTIGRIRDRRRALGLCMYCRYPVRGLESPLCPECGRAIPPPPPPPPPPPLSPPST